MKILIYEISSSSPSGKLWEQTIEERPPYPSSTQDAWDLIYRNHTLLSGLIPKIRRMSIEGTDGSSIAIEVITPGYNDAV